MKTKLYIILFVLSCSANSIVAQAFKFGTITTDLGVGGGFYVSSFNFPGKTGNHNYVDAEASLPSVDAEFGLLKFVGAGVHFSKGAYTLASIGSAKSTDYGITLNFHIANKKDHFDLPIGITYGFTSFRSSESIKTNSAPEHIYGDGTLLSVHILPHFYFGKYIGMFVGFEYSNKYYSKTEWLDVDGRTYSKADGFDWKMDGLQFRLGIAGRFQIVKSKNQQ